MAEPANSGAKVKMENQNNPPASWCVRRVLNHGAMYDDRDGFSTGDACARTYNPEGPSSDGAPRHSCSRVRLIMKQVGNIYVIATVAVVGGGLVGFDIASMSAQLTENSYKCYFN
jgi:hypothetical protein